MSLRRRAITPVIGFEARHKLRDTRACPDWPVAGRGARDGLIQRFPKHTFTCEAKL